MTVDSPSADSPDGVDRLACAAAAAFAITGTASDATRAAWLRAAADRLDAHVDELVAIADEETALGQPRLRGEVARTTGQLRLFAAVVEEGSYLEAVIDHADPAATPPRPELRRILRPLGPVAVFAASNFPFAFSVAGGDTASALAVGCPVIVKAHPGHPRLSQRTAQLIEQALRGAGAPEGVFGLVEGRQAALALVDHPAIQAVAFTGSVAGGRALYDRAAARPAPIPFFGELGSINPVVVTPGADAERGSELAAGLAASFQLGAGQFCTKPGTVFVPAGSALEAALPEHVDPQAKRLLTESISAGFHSGLQQLLEVPGVQLLAGAEEPAAPGADGAGIAAVDGRADVAGGSTPDTAVPLVLTVDIEQLETHAEQLLAEVFGPVTLLIRYRDPAQLRAAIERFEGSLTATLHAAAGEGVAELLTGLERIAGRVLFAGWPTGVAVVWAQHHGGPWPATTSQFTSVGATAVRRFQRPIAYQDAPAELLPVALHEDNPLGIPRRVDGVLHAAVR